MIEIIHIAPEPNRAGRHLVTFSDGSVRKLLPSVIGDLGLYTGLSLDEEGMEALNAAESAANAKQRAIHIISATTVSGRELTRRLKQKGATPEDAENTVRWLEELALLDDAKAAQQVVSQGVRRGYGARRIRQMLYEKNIPREYWEDALAQIPPMDGAIDTFIESRLHGQTGEKEVKRTVDALVRRGYTWSEIKEGLRRYEIAMADEIEED